MLQPIEDLSYVATHKKLDFMLQCGI